MNTTYSRKIATILHVISAMLCILALLGTMSLAAPPKPPPAPVVTSPTDGATVPAGNLDVLWQKEPMATSFEVYAYSNIESKTSPQPRKIYANSTNVNRLPYVLKNLTPGIVFIRVGSTNSTGTSWTDLSVFVQLAAPVITEPKDGSQVAPGALTLKWAKVADATSYRISATVVSTGRKLADMVATSAMEYKLANLPAGETVQMDVAAVGSMGLGAKTSLKVSVSKTGSSSTAPTTSALAGSADKRKCELGQAYVIGKKFPIEVTVKDLAYSIGRVKVGNRYVRPNPDEKLLVVRYSMRNASDSRMTVGQNTIDWLAIDANGVGRTQKAVCVEETGSPLDRVVLPTDQSAPLNCYACFAVPVKGAADTLLMGASREAPDSYYDVSGKVAPLPAPYADPADPTGSTPLQIVPAKLDQAYAVDYYDIKVSAPALLTQPVAAITTNANQACAVATLTITSFASGPGVFACENIRLRDTEGQTYRRVDTLSATSLRSIDLTLDPGETLECLIAYRVPKETTLKSLLMGDSATGRTIAVDLTQSALQPPTTLITPTSALADISHDKIPPADNLKRLALPTWPSKFSLAANDHVVFGIPNPGYGSVEVNVKWSGSPVTVEVTSSAGGMIGPFTQNASPYKLTFAASTNVSECPVFLLRLATGPAAGTQAIGEVMVTSPPLGLEAGSQLEKLDEEQRLNSAQALQQAQQRSDTFVSAAKAEMLARAKSEEEQKLELSKSLQSQALNEASQLGKARIAMASAKGIPGSSALQAIGILTKPKEKPVALLKVPTLSAVAPAQGMSGAQVTLSGEGLAVNATEVYFTVAPGVDVQAAILTHTVASNGIAALQVQVPEKAGIVAAYDGQVYAKATDRQPAETSNKLAFRFEPIVTPSITYIDPVEVDPQANVNIDGNNFSNTDVVHFVIPGLSDFAVATALTNSTRVSAQVPLYSSRQIATGSVYVAKKTPTGWANSQAQVMIFRPTVPVITDIPTTAVADTPILIRGMTFGQTGEVHCMDSDGLDSVLTTDSWSDTHITARLPAPVGFTGSKPYRIYIKTNAGKSDQRSISLTPIIDHILMDMVELKQTLDYKVSSKGGDYSMAKYANDSTMLYMLARHEADMFTGHKDDDYFFLNRKLKNGWTVENIDFQDIGNGPFGGHGARLETHYEDYYGSSSPLVKVHWWCDASWGTAYYQFRIHIQGPKGTGY